MCHSAKKAHVSKNRDDKELVQLKRYVHAIKVSLNFGRTTVALKQMISIFIN